MDGGADELDEVVAALGCSATAAQVFDADGRLYWVSEDMVRLIGAGDDDEIGLGRRIDDGEGDPVWRAALGDEGLAAVRSALAPRLARDAPHPSVWVNPGPLRLTGRRLAVGALGLTVRTPDGTYVGTAIVYAPTLPARVLARLSEGDEAMFARAADLTVPAQRPAAVLFVDLDGSGPLSRRLPTPTYFELVRGITSAFDDLVAEHGGVVGKHAGDGASGFFLAANHDGDAPAARAALATALALPDAVRAHVEAMAARGLVIGGVDACRFNVGLHWGANLYLGQVVTGGRLEVTALGDEVNECARIEQAATDGQVLVSKTLVERLAPGALVELGVVVEGLLYRTLGELAPGTKAARDAGSLAVVDVGSARAEPPDVLP